MYIFLIHGHEPDAVPASPWPYPRSSSHRLLFLCLVQAPHPFYLAGRRFGPANLQLTGVSLSDTTLDNLGRILKGKITINLTEYAEEASSKKAGAGGSSKSSSAAGVSSSGGVGRRLSAVTVGASSSDKAAKKPNNAQLK